MRTLSKLLTAILVLFVFIPAQAAGLPEAEHKAAVILDEIRQFDAQNAGLQAEWEKEIRLHQGQNVPTPLAAKHAWMLYNRQQKTVEALEALANVYDLSQPIWAEGAAQVADTGKGDDAFQAVRLAEAIALDNAGKVIADKLTPPAVLNLIAHAPIAVKAEKIAADGNGAFTRVKQVKKTDGNSIETSVRLQARPAVINPYRAAAQTRLAELKVTRLELLRQYPVLNASSLSWEAKLVAVKPNGETITEIKLTSLEEVISDGWLKVTKEIADREFAGLDSSLIRLKLFLRVPAGINGDSAKLELVVKDRETNGIRRLNMQLHGLESTAMYEFQSFTPPIITLAAGSVNLPNSRLRVGETVIRLENENPSVVAVELKNSEIAAYSSSKLTRKLAFTGQVGQLQSISIVVPGLAAIDSIRLFGNGVLVLADEFNGRSSILLNANWR